MSASVQTAQGVAAQSYRFTANDANHQVRSLMLAMDGRNSHLMVAPPHRSDGVADMLIALGDARIEVTAVEARIDARGRYLLTVTQTPELAARILEGIGCQVDRTESTLTRIATLH
jgi:hypothetical protein